MRFLLGAIVIMLVCFLVSVATIMPILVQYSFSQRFAVCFSVSSRYLVIDWFMISWACFAFSHSLTFTHLRGSRRL